MEYLSHPYKFFLSGEMRDITDLVAQAAQVVARPLIDILTANWLDYAKEWV